MPLVLDEDQLMLRDAARGFLSEKAPVSQLRALRDAADPDGFSRDTWKAMADMGWTGVVIPEEHGGVDMGVTAAGLIAEEMGRTLTASPFIASAVVAATALKQAGSDAHKQRWLPQIASGAAVLSLAVDEGRRHAPAKTALAATRAGNGFKLDGEKTFVVDGHVADAVIVAARTAGAPGEEGGVTLFLVESGAAGLTSERTIMADSRNAARLTFDAVEVTADAVLGEVDGGFQPLERALDAGRAGVAAEMLGAATESFDRTLVYLKEREQFGTLIGSFQALQHRAAHLFAELELAVSAVRSALSDLDEGAEMAPATVALAKAKLGQVAQACAREAVQMHGGVGVTDEYDIGFFMKRIRVAEALYGDANFHLDRLARLRGF